MRRKSARAGPRCGSRVKWPFHVLKRVFDLTKVRYCGLEKSRTETPCETRWADSASNLKSSGGMSMLSHKRLEPVGAGLFNKAHLIVEFPDGTTSTFTVPRPAQLDATRQNARGFLDPNRYLSDPNRHFEMQP